MINRRGGVMMMGRGKSIGEGGVKEMGRGGVKKIVRGRRMGRMMIEEGGNNLDASIHKSHTHISPILCVPAAHTQAVYTSFDLALFGQ